MTAKARRRIEVALDVADHLESSGDKFRAEAVRSLCRACSSYATTMSQLHKDNMELRNKFVVSAESLVRRGAPCEGVLQFTIDGELSGATLVHFDAAAHERQCDPAELVAEVLTAVARDNLFAAVIDA